MFLTSELAIFSLIQTLNGSHTENRHGAMQVESTEPDVDLPTVWAVEGMCWIFGILVQGDQEQELILV